MQILNVLRLVIGVGLLVFGLFFFALEQYGAFKFNYVLNRMHAAATGDTLGIGTCLVGLMVLSGFNFTTMKMALIVFMLWLASPVSSHLIARLEVVTNDRIEDYCKVPTEEGWEDDLC